MSLQQVHFVLSSHWDREWLSPFQDFRYRLVRMMDRVLAGLEDRRIQGPFHTDGQAVIIDDYLEIRPDRREKIEELMRCRKLIVGPWYVMPDEFAVSGESLIRNLRLGRDRVRSTGAQPSCAGYLCDMFGHNSQMPQILRGFAIKAAFLWRGLNIERREFLWRGADGTIIPSHRFGHGGYGRYAHLVRAANDHSQMTHDRETFIQRLEYFVQTEAKTTDVDAILMLDGSDHQDWDEEAYALLCEHFNRKGERHWQVIHSSLDEFAAELSRQSDHIGLTIEGELREPGRATEHADGLLLSADVLPGVLSSRVWIKQFNRQCESLLFHWAEPFAAFASIATGAEYPQAFLDRSLRWLIENHAHDSMCGCSIDQVHQDMRYRFDQCRMIADRIAIESIQRISANVAGDLNLRELRVTVFNPLPYDIDQVAELSLQIPVDWPTFELFNVIPAFHIFGPDGMELPYQRLSLSMRKIKARMRRTKGPEAYHTHDVNIAIKLAIPAMGYTTLLVRSDTSPRAKYHPSSPGLATSECSMSNEYLTVDIEANGTLRLTDSRTGQVYSRLLTFEDSADIGDGWNHGPAENDRKLFSTAVASSISLVHDGPWKTTFRIRTLMSIPKAFAFDRMSRSEELAELALDTLVMLRAGQDYVEISTTIENVAEDHRVRVLFPTEAHARTYLADSQFDVIERAIPLRADNHEYRELEVETKPQQSWTAVHDAGRGLAVVSDGLLETAVRDLPDRPIALTLFRGTRRTVLTDGEPGGQLRGPMSFRYWIVPLAGSLDRVHLCRLGQRISTGLRVVQQQAQDIAIHRTGKSLPMTATFLSMEGAAVMTSARQVGEYMEVRMFNPTDDEVPVTLRMTDLPVEVWRPSRVQMVNFDSIPLEQVQPIRSNRVEVRLKRKQIVTLQLS